MNNQQIILVNPEGRPEIDALEKSRDSLVYIFPYSLLFLQNYLLANNIQSLIIDLNWQKPDELFDITKSIDNHNSGSEIYSCSSDSS